MMSKAATKEKKSFGKKLFRRGSVRSVGSFMSRVLKTLSTLSHFGTEEHVVENEKDDGGFTVFKSGGKGAVTPGEGDRDGIGGDRVPGLSGLKNHGNTCFMNAVLQCLSNTELFAEYLALEQFRGGGVGAQDELENKDDKGIVHGQKKDAPDGGEVTEQLSGLVRALWTFEYTPQHSREFKVLSVLRVFKPLGMEPLQHFVGCEQLRLSAPALTLPDVVNRLGVPPSPWQKWTCRQMTGENRLPLQLLHICFRLRCSVPDGVTCRRRSLQTDILILSFC